MPTLVLYLATAAGALWLASRTLGPISRRAGVALVLLPLAVTGWAMVSGEVLGPIDQIYYTEPFLSARDQVDFVNRTGGIFTDVYSQMIPWKAAVRYALSQGEWPLWDPFILCGNPLAGSAQPAPYSPVLLLSLLLPLPQSLAFCSALVLFLAALAGFVYARELGCRESTALVAGAGWALSSFVTFWLGWPHAQTAAFLPLVLLGARRVVRQPSLGSTLTLALPLALTVLAGHPETLLHVVALGALGFAWELWDTRPLHWRASLAQGLGAGALAVALTAVYLLPFADALRQSAEFGHRSGHYAEQDRSDAWAVAGANALPSFVPAVSGKPGYRHYKPPFGWNVPGSGYAGSVLLAPALFALFRSKRRERWLLLGLGLFGLAAGVNAPGVADLLARLPLFNITINERLVLAFAFSTAMLAALGIEAWIEERDRRLAWAYLGVTSVLGLVCTLVWPFLAQEGFPGDFFALKTVALLLPPLLLALACGWKRLARWAAPALLVLLLAQRTVETRVFFQSLPERMYYPVVKPLDALPQDESPYRVTASGYSLIPNTSVFYGIEDPRGYQAMRLARLVETFRMWTVSDSTWFNRVDDFSTPFLAFLNVRYAVIPRDVTRPPGWQRVGRGKGSFLWRNPKALERAFVPNRVRLGGAWPVVRSEMEVETDFGERSWIALPDAPEEGLPEGRANGPGRVSITKKGLGYVLTTAMKRPGWVVVSVAHFKGWRATVRGKELPIAYANRAFIAVRAPAGESTIRLKYRPRSFVIGRAVTLAAILGLLGLGGWRRRSIFAHG